MSAVLSQLPNAFAKGGAESASHGGPKARSKLKQIVMLAL